MDDLEEIRRQLQEERRLRQEQEHRLEEERRLRQEQEHRLEEERRLRQKQEHRLKEERRIHQEERRLRQEERHEEQRRRQEQEHRIEEEQRLRQSVEKDMLQTTIMQYLEACHSLDDINVVTDCALTTQGATTNPTGRVFPRRIIPWSDFKTQQEKIWETLSKSEDFFNQKVFPSKSHIDGLRLVRKPISCESGLRTYESTVVECAVEKLVQAVSKDPSLQRNLDINGSVTFESHTNYRTSANTNSTKQENTASSTAAARPPATPKPRRKRLGKGGSADQFCIYDKLGGQVGPVLAIEYKAPHKLDVGDVVTGLKSGSIEPERDVIDKDGEDYEFNSRRLVTAVITQLFSYMVGKGLKYGYICTGQVFLFLHIADDPSTVYYSVCVPKEDVMDTDKARLHRTAVAQVFAFTLQAMASKMPSQSWFDKLNDLDVWTVEYEKVLQSTQKDRKSKKELRVTPYRAKPWDGPTRSPVGTRARVSCESLRGNDHPTDNDEDPPSPSPHPRPGSGTAGGTSDTGSAAVKADKREERGSTSNQNIQSRSYCTQLCLEGLARGGPMDKTCPNLSFHGKEHITRHTFLSCVRNQLATDRGPDADCIAMKRAGAVGALFKVRLSSHGYTLVAKGVESHDKHILQHEEAMYARLVSIQGLHIPVCLGNIELIRPWYFDGGVYTHFMFLGWAGRPIFECVDHLDEAVVLDGVTEVFKAMHRLRALHGDAEPRNILYDNAGKFMAVDLERAEYCGGRANLDKKRRIHESEEDEFARELAYAVETCRRCVESYARKFPTRDFQQSIEI
ncbi:hypothetical protein E4U55_004315 [Claviceps digitariae]|nr:hypothetical protein E4U55_004315 [Claviceps digitariae]